RPQAPRQQAPRQGAPPPQAPQPRALPPLRAPPHRETQPPLRAPRPQAPQPQARLPPRALRPPAPRRGPRALPGLPPPTPPMPWSKQLFLSLHDLRLHRELLAGEAERLLRERLRDAGELEHHAPRLDHADPALWRALAGAHPGLGGLLREALVGEDVDPDLAA